MRDPLRNREYTIITDCFEKVYTVHFGQYNAQFGQLVWTKEIKERKKNTKELIGRSINDAAN